MTEAENGRDWSVSGVLDAWMRHDAASAHARLLHRFGWRHAERIEDALQEALLRAVETWPYSGVPDRPGGWIYRVAANRMLDMLRGADESRRVPLELAPEEWLASSVETRAGSAGALSDPELEVLFAASHPALPMTSAIALALQVLCGFSLQEIASALILKPDAVAQRLSRAKRVLRDIPDAGSIPAGSELVARRSIVLDVISLIFNEGYEPSSGDLPMRLDFCAEAVRLANAVAAHRVTAGPEASALAALVNLLFARVPARAVDPGCVILLPEQDRSLWSQTHLRSGFEHIRQSARGSEISRYHLLAGIAAVHAAAQSIEETDWSTIVGLYRTLTTIEASPVHRLNFAVALLQAGDATEAAAEIERAAASRVMRNYFWFHVARAEIELALEHCDAARFAIDDAAALATSPAQRRYAVRKRAEIQGLRPQAGVIS